jgi:hypothetical protein
MIKDPKILSAVLEGYAAATPEGNDSAVLREWIRRHPDFADDLADFAASRTVMLYAAGPEPTIEEEERLRGLATERLAAVLGESRGLKPIASILRRATELGYSKQSFAAAAGLSVSLVMYLEKRRLEFASIPRELVRRVAEIIGSAEESVAAYLRQGPDLAPAANYKASLMPGEVVEKSFADAVREDQVLSPEEKVELLKMANQ